MGKYINPGNRRFDMAIKSEIFIDKTEMIDYLNTVVNTNQRFVSVSRPRRFGKTLVADMLCAYYDYYAAERYYTTILELNSGKGYEDIVFLPSPKFTDKPAMLVELKYEKDAVTALSQIKKQRYPERLRHYKGNILLVGINYEKGQSPKQEGFKHHSCVIENA